MKKPQTMQKFPGGIANLNLMMYRGENDDL